MVLALQAGVVSQELLDALTAVDNKLSSACLFAEYWDTHSERDAWFQQHLSSQLHSLAVPLHQWCCDHSASWARGAVHIPVYSSPPSCQPAAPSSVTTTSVTGSKRRYAAITSNGRHRPQPSSSLPPDGPLSKAAREQEEYQQVLEVTINLVASLGQVPGLLQELSSSTLGPAKQIARLRKIISATAPSAGTLRAHNLSFKRFLMWGSDRKLSPSECFLKTTNIDIADFMEKLAYLGCSVPKSTASSLAWWVKFLDVPASFSLTASVIMAEIKSSRKDHEVKGAVQARPFQLCHMRQVESVCVRATNPVHSALAAWVALLAHAGLRAEDSQRLKVGSCGFTDVAIHGVCRNPKPRGVSNMPWAALRCGVLDEDWGKHAWDNLLSFCSRLQLDFVLPGVSGDFSSLDWSRWATKNEQVASLWFVLTHPQGIAPLSEELAFQFTPHSPRFFYTSVGSTFGFSVSERCAFGNWAEGSNMPKRYDSSFCGEQLTRRGELLGLLQAGWSPPNVNAPGLPRAPSGAIGIPRTPTGKPILFGNCAPHPGASAPLSPDVFRRLSSSAFAGLLRFHRSDLGDRKLHVAKSENSKIAKCGFLLPSSSAVAISDLDRLIGEGVTLCGHACFNTTCSLATVLKGGADCDKTSRHG